MERALMFKRGRAKLNRQMASTQKLDTSKTVRRIGFY
jgi:hypothetical protein